MAKTKPNDLVSVINSSGREFPARRTWAEKKCAAGECEKSADGVYRFHPHPQANAGAGSVSGLAGRRDQVLTFPVRRLEPNEAAPYEGFSFLAYPMARGGSRGSLASRYPALARDGAGMR
jgi:hypothetical protein